MPSRAASRIKTFSVNDTTFLPRMADSAIRNSTPPSAAHSSLAPSQIDLVSRRVGDYQYGACVGALLDQLWVR